MFPDMDMNIYKKDDLSFRQLNYLITDHGPLTEQLTYDLIDKNECNCPLRNTLMKFFIYLFIAYMLAYHLPTYL